MVQRQAMQADPQPSSPLELEELHRYVDFSEQDARTLKEALPVAQPHFEQILSEFYAKVWAHPAAAAVLTGGPAQVERLKQTLYAWLTELFEGPFDQSYFERRARIGHRHVEIELPQQYMLTAMNQVRRHLLDAMLAAGGPQLPQRVRAVNKVLDIDLAIMLHVYRQDHEARLQSAERLATFGEMTSTICQELRNPLGVIETSAFLLARRLDEDTDGRAHLDKIQRHVRRANDMTNSMLRVVREQPALRGHHAPQTVAQAALQSLREIRGMSAALHFEPDLPALFVDAGQIQQILENLLLNAADAAGSEGEVRLDIHRDGAWVELQVSDSGPGIEPQVRARIFEPLVTTKPSGVGLGLTLCRKLALANEGVLELSEGPLPGAAFSLRLPVC